MVDLTNVRGLFGIVTFKVGVVFDAFSRMTLSVRVFTKEPAAEEIARLVTRTAKRHGRPSHISAIPPPRGRPGEGPMDSPFRVEYLDAERMLPVLVRKAA
jgi:hypothetical protein